MAGRTDFPLPAPGRSFFADLTEWELAAQPDAMSGDTVLDDETQDAEETTRTWTGWDTRRLVTWGGCGVDE